MINSLLDIHPVESKDLNRYFTFSDYGQIIIDLDAIMAELQLA